MLTSVTIGRKRKREREEGEEGKVGGGRGGATEDAATTAAVDSAAGTASRERRGTSIERDFLGLSLDLGATLGLGLG